MHQLRLLAAAPATALRCSAAISCRSRRLQLLVNQCWQGVCWSAWLLLLGCVQVELQELGIVFWEAAVTHLLADEAAGNGALHAATAVAQAAGMPLTTLQGSTICPLVGVH